MSPLENISLESEAQSCDMSSVRASTQEALENSYLDQNEAKAITQSLENDINSCAAERKTRSESLLESVLIQGVTTTSLTDNRTESYLGFSAETIRKQLTEQGIVFPDIYSIRKDGDLFYFHDTEGNAIAQYDRSSQEAGEVSGIDFMQRDDISDNMYVSDIAESQQIADSSVLVLESLLKLQGEDAIREEFETLGALEVTVDSTIDNPDILKVLSIISGKDAESIKTSIGEIYAQMGADNTPLALDDLLRVERKGAVLEISVARNNKLYSQIL